MFKYLITQKVFILVGKARPSMDGLDPPLAPNSGDTQHHSDPSLPVLQPLCPHHEAIGSWCTASLSGRDVDRRAGDATFDYKELASITFDFLGAVFTALTMRFHFVFGVFVFGIFVRVSCLGKKLER